MRFQCPLCNGIVAVDNSACGIKVQCGHCAGVIDVPASRVAPGAIIADFIIKKELGRGGMGVVYLAHQISLDRLSALKVLSENYANDAQFVGNFIKEARAAAKLNHPHIVQAYAVGEDDGIFYFAMEDIEGKTMKEVLREQQVIPGDQALLIIQQIAEALDYAWHEQKLIHRDIKPDNIMLTNSGRAKLSDLGLASVAGEIDESNADEIMGTPQYISPEHLTGAPMDVRSDIYSLGATFYHFVTGNFPYSGNSVNEIAQQHLTGTLIPPNEVNPDVPADITAIIMKMMQRNPADRYQSTGQLIDDIRIARHAVDGVTATIQLPQPGAPAKKTGQIRSGSTTSGKQLTLRKSGGTATATKIRMTATTTGAKKIKKKNTTRNAILFAAGAAVLIAGGGIGAYFFLRGDSGEAATVAVQENLPPPPPPKSEFEIMLTDFCTNAQVSEAGGTLDAAATVAKCENFILQKPENMNPDEAKYYETMLQLYHKAEETLLTPVREAAATALQEKINAEAKRIADAKEAERRKIEEEKAKRRAAELAEAKRKAEEAALKAKQDKAVRDLEELKKNTAAKIVAACAGENPARAAREIKSILELCKFNPYKDETDEVIQPVAQSLAEWADSLTVSFSNAAKVMDLMKGKDEALDDLEVIHPKKPKQKIVLKYQNQKLGITINFMPMEKFMKSKNGKVYIPAIVVAVAEKAGAADDLWAYKMITGADDKTLPEDLDTGKMDELRKIAGASSIGNETEE